MIFFVARRIIASALAFFLRLFYCSQELLKLCIFDKFVPIQNLSRKFLDAGLWLVNCINNFVKVNFRKAWKLELFPWKFLRMPTRKQCIQEIMYYVARQDSPNCKLITLFMVGNTAPFTRVCRLSICITQEDHVFRRSEFLFMLFSKTSGLIYLLI